MSIHVIRRTSRYHGRLTGGAAPVVIRGYSAASNSTRDVAHNIYWVVTQDGPARGSTDTDGIVLRREATTGWIEEVFRFRGVQFGKIADCSIEVIGPYLMVMVSEREIIYGREEQVQKLYLLENCGVAVQQPWPPR